jgi:succinoglycan biosynthesis transport protein ExoP
MRRVKVALDAGTSGSVVLGVTSVVSHEGRSTVAANLAQVLAATGARTLLVDADLRRPSLSKRLAPGANAGVTEVIEGARRMEDVVWSDPATNLDFLPALPAVPVDRRAALLASGPAEVLFAAMRSRYRYVVLDTAPLAPVADTQAMSDMVDVFLLVVEWGETHPAAVQETLKSADPIRSRMIGAVLNKADVKELRRLERYKGSRFYESTD